MWRARTKRLDPPAPGVAPFAAPDSWVGVGSPPRKANEMALPSEGKKREASEIAASPPGQDGQNGINASTGAAGDGQQRAAPGHAGSTCCGSTNAAQVSSWRSAAANKRKKNVTGTVPPVSVTWLSQLMSKMKSPGRDQRLEGGDVPSEQSHALVVANKDRQQPISRLSTAREACATAARGSQVMKAIESVELHPDDGGTIPRRAPYEQRTVTSTYDREQTIVLQYRNKIISVSSLADIKREQRGNRGMWSNEWAFPGQISRPGCRPDVFERNALERATQWICHACLGCTLGDCAAQLLTSDVYKLRQEALVRCEGPPGGARLPLWQIVQSDLFNVYDRSREGWSRINVVVDQHTSVQMCPSAYGLAMGLSGPMFYDHVVRPIQQGNAVQLGAGSGAKRILSKEEMARKRSLALTMLEAYVRDLVNQHEQQPAPGAARQNGETVISKRSWTQKWEACCQYFATTGQAPPGSKSMLKRVWKVCPPLMLFLVSCMPTFTYRTFLCIPCSRTKPLHTG